MYDREGGWVDGWLPCLLRDWRCVCLVASLRCRRCAFPASLSQRLPSAELLGNVLELIHPPPLPHPTPPPPTPPALPCRYSEFLGNALEDREPQRWVYKVYLVPLASTEPRQLALDRLWVLDSRSRSLAAVEPRRLAPPGTPEEDLRLRITR